MKQNGAEREWNELAANLDVSSESLVRKGKGREGKGKDDACVGPGRGPRLLCHISYSAQQITTEQGSEHSAEMYIRDWRSVQREGGVQERGGAYTEREEAYMARRCPRAPPWKTGATTETPRRETERQKDKRQKKTGARRSEEAKKHRGETGGRRFREGKGMGRKQGEGRRGKERERQCLPAWLAIVIVIVDSVSGFQFRRVWVS